MLVACRPQVLFATTPEMASVVSIVNSVNLQTSDSTVDERRNMARST
jgi:hypothetical protein